MRGQVSYTVGKGALRDQVSWHQGRGGPRDLTSWQGKGGWFPPSDQVSWHQGRGGPRDLTSWQGRGGWFHPRDQVSWQSGQVWLHYDNVSLQRMLTRNRPLLMDMLECWMCWTQLDRRVESHDPHMTYTE